MFPNGLGVSGWVGSRSLIFYMICESFVAESPRGGGDIFLVNGAFSGNTELDKHNGTYAL